MKLLRPQRGAVLFLVYILAFFSLISITAFSMNTALLAQEKLQLEQAIEAIALAIGVGGDRLQQADVERIKDTYVQAFFNDEQQGRINIVVEPPSTVDQSHRVSGEINSRLFFGLSLRGQDAQVRVESQVEAVKERDRLEVAMVLDVSGSMGINMGALRSSSKQFVDTLFASRVDDEQVYISLVPFDHKVNIGNARAVWTTGGPCASAYRFPANQPQQHILDLPQGGASLFPGSTDCNASALLPLTNNQSDIVASLDGLSDSGFTEIDNGLAWAWRTLAPSWQGMWSETPARPLNDQVKKVILVFTDGNGYADRDVFANMCDQLALQEPAIELFAIQFNSENDELKNCAPDLQHYYQANDANALQRAFDDIAEKVGFLLRLRRV